MWWGAAKQSRLICGISQGEILACLLIVGIIASFAAHGALAALAHVRQVEVLTLAVRGKVYWAEQWASAGRDQDARPFIEHSPRGARSVALPSASGDGSFSYQMTSGPAGSTGGTITIRAAMSTDKDVTSLIWICGNRPVPRGFVAVGENLTSLAADQLVSACRGRL